MAVTAGWRTRLETAPMPTSIASVAWRAIAALANPDSMK